MIEAFGIPLGTVFQGGTFGAALIVLAVVARTYILGIPERARVRNEAKVIDNAEVAMRFKEWRAEVHAMKNELAVVKAELHSSNAQRARNRDRFNMVLFILRLVMTELRRLDPQSAVIRQADALLAQVTEEEESPEDAVSAAKATVASAEVTLEEVKKDAGK